MSTKSVLSPDSRDSRSVKYKRTEVTTPSSAMSMSTDYPLAQALRFGVLKFLTTCDAAELLNCCKFLRNDSKLARSVLLMGTARNSSTHFFRECELDWFSLHVTRTPLDKNYSCKSCYYHSETEMSDAVGKSLGVAQRPFVNTQLVSLIAAFEKFVLSVYSGEDLHVTSYGDRVYAVPVNLHPGHEWTREDVRVALNAIHKRFGDRFTEEDPAKGAPSIFRAHWEHIEMSAGGEITCTLCDKWRYITKRLDAVVAMTKSGDDRSVVLDALIENVVREDDEYTNCSELQLLMMDEAGELDLLAPFPKSQSWNSETLPGMLDEDDDFLEVCRTFAQPLKKFLLQFCKLTSRIAYLEANNKMDLIEERTHGKVQPLAGVTASGFLCGSYFVRNQH